VQSAHGVVRTLSAKPGQLTMCECGRWLEYRGEPGKLRLKFASRKRVRAFRELERDLPVDLEIASVVRYVAEFSAVPQDEPSSTGGSVRFTFFLGS